MVNNFAPSFGKIPERSSMPEGLVLSDFLSILKTLPDIVFAKVNLSFKFQIFVVVIYWFHSKLFSGFASFKSMFSTGEE